VSLIIKQRATNAEEEPVEPAAAPRPKRPLTFLIAPSAMRISFLTLAPQRGRRPGWVASQTTSQAIIEFEDKNYYP